MADDTLTRLINIQKHVDSITHLTDDIEDELEGIEDEGLEIHLLLERVSELKSAKEAVWKEAKRARQRLPLGVK